MRYVTLADTLRDRIADGATGPLESEAELGREYGVSRVTVRRALELLRDEGLVAARHGVGWFVAVDPVRQSLGRVTTLEAALEAAGAVAGRRVLEFAFETPSPDVAKTRVVRRGDTLSAIAAEEYGDPAVWRPIARANGIVDPRRLPPGQVLTIPVLQPAGGAP